MRKSRFIILFFIANACSNSQKNKDDIVVNFNVQNPTYSKVAIVQSPELIDEIELDKNGKTHLYLTRRFNICPLVLWRRVQECLFSKGDQLTISFDAGEIQGRDSIRRQKRPGQ